MWNCDVCGQTIEKVEDGWVEWLDSSSGKGKGLRLVHAYNKSPRNGSKKCQYGSDQIVSDLPLKSFSGPDGLVQLLVMISENELPKSEVLDMIQRIHVPGYEAARKYFKGAVSEGVIEPNLPEGFYFQDDIKAAIKFGKSQ